MEKDVNSLTEQITSSMNQIQLSDKANSCEKEIFCVISQCVHSLSEDTSYSNKWFEVIDSVIDRLWEKLNTGKWQDVPESYRDLYAFASYIKTGIILKQVYNLTGSTEALKVLTDAIKAADMGLLLGSSMRKELSEIATKLCRLIHLVSVYENGPEERSFPSVEQAEVKLRGESIPVLICPSVESFSANYFNSQTPVKLKGCIEHWPALQKWRNVNYILEKIGPRTVPIEIGSSYASFEWSQKLMTVNSFIGTYMLNNSSEIGYLAQHQLFNQIPELLEDIREPEYCFLSDTYQEGDGIDVNAWFGPAHTVSPMHHDPKHNLLAQVVGSKVILLADPKFNENVYPHEDNLLFNTSRVNPENPDFVQFPKFKDAKLLQCVLEPGIFARSSGAFQHVVELIVEEWNTHIRLPGNSFVGIQIICTIAMKIVKREIPWITVSPENPQNVESEPVLSSKRVYEVIPGVIMRLADKSLLPNGINEKIIVVRKTEFDCVLLLNENEKDFDDLHKFIADGLEVHFVKQYHFSPESNFQLSISPIFR